MKFWQLTAIVSWQPNTSEKLEEVLKKPQWEEFYTWHKNIQVLCDTQDREKLDYIMPSELCVEVLENLPGILYLADDYLRSFKMSESDKEISVLDAYKAYGGTLVEESYERGAVNINDTRAKELIANKKYYRDTQCTKRSWRKD